MLTSEEKKEVSRIEGIYYMKPLLDRVGQKIKKVGLDKALDYAHEMLVASKDDVENMLDDRVSKGTIKDKSQARKSIAGAAFSNLLKYLFLKNKEVGLVREDISITSSTKEKIFEDMVTIHVGDETQKPDMDLVIYSVDEKGAIKKCMIISLKTSLRERAGQTYKWKLLLEIASTSNNIKDKYKISYNSATTPIVCFATVNFYNEINNPQHKGMFKFFDNSFIGKPLNSDFISNLSAIVDYANNNL